MTNYDSAFDKLVDVSVEQTKIMTEQAMLLRNLIDKIDDVAERHEKSADSTRIYIKDIVTDTAQKSDLWWKRALILVSLAILVSDLLGGTSSAFLARLLGLGK